MRDFMAEIEAGACLENYGCNTAKICMCALATEIAEEVGRLREALRKIAWDDYSDDDLAVEHDQPTMVWNGIARAAIDPVVHASDCAVAQAARYELRQGKFGAYFHDTNYGGFDMPLDMVLEKLNRLEAYTKRLAKANEGRPINDTF